MKKFQALLDQLTAGLDTQAYTLDQTSELVSRHIQAELGCAQVSVWLLDSRPEGPFLRHQVGYDGHTGQVLGPSEGVCHPNLVPYVEEITQRGLFVSDDAWADARLAPLHESFLGPLNIRAVLYATIGTNGNLSALLCCAETTGPRQWSAAEVRTLKAYADAISLRRARRHRRTAEAASLAERLLVDQTLHHAQPLAGPLPDD